MSIFACFLTDNFHIHYLFNLFKFYTKQQLNISSTGWCLLFDIIHSVKREVSCKRQVLFITFFLYNSIVNYGLFTCLLVQAGSHGYL